MALNERARGAVPSFLVPVLAHNVLACHWHKTCPLINVIQKVGRDIRARDRGRILITGSVAGFMPGSFQAVYSGTKAFINSFLARTVS
jgi:NAD(P)-dependent dehydrogenase (short-subunit alcohol dehydrogenase family)